MRPRLLARLGRGYLMISVIVMALGASFAAGTAFGIQVTGRYCLAKVSAILHQARPA